MPKFQGEEDPEAYLSWVRKVDKIFRIHNYSNAKKVAMASLEFEDYASVWWDEFNDKREANLLEPIDTWEEMKQVIHTRFVPSHHKRDLFNKLTQLKQSFKSVEEYYKEMHMTMMSANVDEREEQTMARSPATTRFDPSPNLFKSCLKLLLHPHHARGLLMGICLRGCITSLTRHEARGPRRLPVGLATGYLGPGATGPKPPGPGATGLKPLDAPTGREAQATGEGDYMQEERRIPD
ncbi:hypothetical protein QYE76_053078 [Lolium multiflorum]|uniref:Retrotransposon gag domain-containing protein n=1 Tax=Lolium multiflorum TaxID=4521 RepID=A0AAD8SW79_LOLMU|nr:hypothetical protein QYE76_053078 [Lolium multiflorum]